MTRRICINGLRHFGGHCKEGLGHDHLLIGDFMDEKKNQARRGGSIDGRDTDQLRLDFCTP